MNELMNNKTGRVAYKLESTMKMISSPFMALNDSGEKPCEAKTKLQFSALKHQH
jgi:hypothetical protein